MKTGNTKAPIQFYNIIRKSCVSVLRANNLLMQAKCSTKYHCVEANIRVELLQLNDFESVFHQENFFHFMSFSLT